MKNIARGSPALDTSDLLEQLTSDDPSQRSSGVQVRAARAEPARRATAMVCIDSPAEAHLLEPTYGYLSTYCSTCLSPPLAERLNVAIYELLANALTYGAGFGDVRLELRRFEAGASVTITNGASGEAVAALRRHVARVMGDPAAAFAEEMDRFSDRREPPPMLGLVRIIHHSGLDIELEVAADRVSLTASCSSS